MRFYQQQHPFYCGIDLHAKTMYVCIVDQAGEILEHRDIKTRPDARVTVEGASENPVRTKTNAFSTRYRYTLLTREAI